jgi:MarR family transcriptional regulator, lower aerobic nicotinate degradation pathway regulator
MLIYMMIIHMSIMKKTQTLPDANAEITKGALISLASDVPPVRRVPLALARRFFQICNAVAAQTLAEDQLQPLQFAVMAYVNRKIGEPGIDQTSLAARMGIDRNSASKLVLELQEKKLLLTKVSALDRRARQLWLTPRGERLYLHLAPLAFADQSEILKPLNPEDRDRFLDMLLCVIEGNRALARPGAARRKRGSALSPPPTHKL